ncbi:hypothetical protein HDV00_002116 [Rhizophlyctis rosea]|nr:hypothetical protein HDV00_002116 [Rhizophlyctis rosea]
MEAPDDIGVVGAKVNTGSLGTREGIGGLEGIEKFGGVALDVAKGLAYGSSEFWMVGLERRRRRYPLDRSASQDSTQKKTRYPSPIPVSLL